MASLKNTHICTAKACERHKADCCPAFGPDSETRVGYVIPMLLKAAKNTSEFIGFRKDANEA